MKLFLRFSVFVLFFSVSASLFAAFAKFSGSLDSMPCDVLGFKADALPDAAILLFISRNAYSC